jgi:hypothetical protein
MTAHLHVHEMHMTHDDAPATVHPCPICSQPVRVVERYPDYVCNACALRASSVDGRSLRFTNASSSGGFIATYADTGEPYASGLCWIDGVACKAQEARFGGIVIQPLQTVA